MGLRRPRMNERDFGRCQHARQLGVADPSSARICCKISAISPMNGVPLGPKCASIRACNSESLSADARPSMNSRDSVPVIRKSRRSVSVVGSDFPASKRANSACEHLSLCAISALESPQLARMRRTISAMSVLRAVRGRCPEWALDASWDLSAISGAPHGAVGGSPCFGFWPWPFGRRHHDALAVSRARLMTSRSSAA